ncbi:MAG: SMP-30/gluconolactonase/LRE family protein [Dehalococcoidia bacterium]|nr:SMP-30/gluconolactonase/LRE family protein [Dehalococcoidia bacterium]
MNFRVVAEDLAFPEGPVVLPGGDVLVTEIRTGQLTRIKPDGTKSLYATTGGGPNGAALGPDGAVYVTQNGGFHWEERVMPDGSIQYGPGERPANYIGGQIQRVTADGQVSTLYRECDGEPLKGPNDLVFDREGNFYFTDLGKHYGRQQDRTGVFYASPDGKMIREIIFPMNQPNGCALSPDEKVLYVVETPTGRLWACPLAGPGEVAGRYVLATVPGAPPINLGMCDSMCVDGDGNAIIATLINGGITIVSPDGKDVTHVATGDLFTTNACFGGPDLSTLYVTLSGLGKLVAFDNWPTPGHPLNWATYG